MSEVFKLKNNRIQVKKLVPPSSIVTQTKFPKYFFLNDHQILPSFAFYTGTGKGLKDLSFLKFVGQIGDNKQQSIFCMQF